MQLASFVLDRAVEVLGYHWKKEKHDSTLPLLLLGLSFTVVDGQALCKNTKERKKSLVQELVALKSSAPNEFNLSSIVGKLVIAGKDLCGRAGVHARRPQNQALKDFSIHRKAGVWPAHVLEAIAVCAGTLLPAPPRTSHLDRWQWPSAVLYGDAALSTRRMAAILYIPETCVKKAFSIQVPQTFLESLSPSGHEDLAIKALRRIGSTGHASIGSTFFGPSLIFCDNFTAVRGFIHGSSASPTVCRIVGRTWQCCIENHIISWIVWVHTKSNPADSLTRPGWESAAQRMGLELDEIVWISECPADLQWLLPSGNVWWFQRTTNFEIQWTVPLLGIGLQDSMQREASTKMMAISLNKFSCFLCYGFSALQKG